MKSMRNWSACAVAITTIFFVGRATGRAAEQLEDANKVYELRIYTANDSKLDDLNRRFRDHTVKLFEKHGIKNIGYWVPTDGEKSKNTLIYVVAHKSRDHAKKSWKSFGADPEWKKAYTESHKDGVLVKKVESTYMKPTDYSQLK